LKADKSAIGLHPTDTQLAKLRERSNALHRKIVAWTSIQQAYMPGASVIRQRGERVKQAVNVDIEPEDVELCFPSAVGRRALYDDKLRRYEWEHRIAQANDALNEIRDHLRLRAHLYKFKDKFVRGQRANTRSRSTIKGIEDKVSVSVAKYHGAHRALTQLAPLLKESGWEKLLKPLAKDDVRGLSQAGYDQSEGKRTLSWIWLTPGVSLDAQGNEGSEHVHDGGHICFYCISFY
jgi:hypothetical protein